MIDRDVEKSLHLLRVQIHRQHPAHARRGKEIRDQLGRDRHPRLIFAVLPGVTKERNHRRDAIGARAPRRIHHDQQLHQVLIRRRTGRLDDEDIAAADVLVDLDVGLAVGERADRRLAKRRADEIADPLREVAVGGARENLELRLESKHASRAATLGANNQGWQKESEDFARDRRADAFALRCSRGRCPRPPARQMLIDLWRGIRSGDRIDLEVHSFARREDSAPQRHRPQLQRRPAGQRLRSKRSAQFLFLLLAIFVQTA